MYADLGLAVRAFFADPRVLAVFLLIVAQVAAAVFVAIRTWTFDGAALADYYRTRVVPYVGGALIVYLLTRHMPAGALGTYGQYLSDGLFDVCWLTLIWTLITKLYQTLRALGEPIPDDPPEPERARDAR